MSINLIRRNRSIRFSDLEWEAIKAAAEKEGKTPGEFIHDVAMEQAKRPDLAALATDLRELIDLLKKRLG